MFDIGFWELTLIGMLALIVLGPKRLPEAARTAGRWAGSLRRFVEGVKRDIDSELNTAELSELRKLKQELSETRQAIEESSSEVFGAFSEEVKSLSTNADEETPRALTEGRRPARSPKKSKKSRKSPGRPRRARASTARKKHVKTKKS